jgi:hypothetical protein
LSELDPDEQVVRREVLCQRECVKALDLTGRGLDGDRTGVHEPVGNARDDSAIALGDLELFDNPGIAAGLRGFLPRGLKNGNVGGGYTSDAAIVKFDGNGTIVGEVRPDTVAVHAAKFGGLDVAGDGLPTLEQNRALHECGRLGGGKHGGGKDGDDNNIACGPFHV